MRHEYIGGAIHAMSGGTTTHNRIALSIASHLRTKLRSGPCKVFIENVKVRLEASREDIFTIPTSSSPATRQASSASLCSSPPSSSKSSLPRPR